MKLIAATIMSLCMLVANDAAGQTASASTSGRCRLLGLSYNGPTSVVTCSSTAVALLLPPRVLRKFFPS
jgi:hypothetical protein